MNLFSIFIVLLLIIWLIASIRYIYKNRNSGCKMDCSNCSKKCSSNRTNVVRKD